MRVWRDAGVNHYTIHWNIYLESNNNNMICYIMDPSLLLLRPAQSIIIIERRDKQINQIEDIHILPRPDD
jgi:hypothetical protein